MESSSRTCLICDEPIPLARLQAMPDALSCTGCLIALGDVKPYRRYDEYVGEEKFETFFVKPDQYLQREMQNFTSNAEYTVGTKLRLMDEYCANNPV